MGGLRKIELEALGKQQEAVEKPLWKHDVVVEDEQPVVRVGGCASSSRLRFSNLPRSAGAPTQSSTWWRERASSSRMRCTSAPCSGRATHRTSTRRGLRRPTRGDVEAQPAGGCDIQRIVGDIERGPAQAIEPADGAAFAGEEVVGGCGVVGVRVGSRLMGAQVSWRRLVALDRRCARAGVRCAERFQQAPIAVADHRQPRGAAVAHDVAKAARERASSRPSDGGHPPGIEAPRGLASREGGSARVTAGAHRRRAPTVECGVRHI